MRQSGLHKKLIEFKTINDLIPQSDLLYCNSVLQYFSSNVEFISLIKKVMPEYIFLEDLVATSDDDFFSVQNYYHTGIPYRFIGLTNLLNEFSEQGYQEIFRSPYPSIIEGVIKPFGMANFPKSKRIRHSIIILFKKCRVK